MMYNDDILNKPEFSILKTENSGLFENVQVDEIKRCLFNPLILHIVLL